MRMVTKKKALMGVQILWIGIMFLGAGHIFRNADAIASEYAPSGAYYGLSNWIGWKIFAVLIGIIISAGMWYGIFKTLYKIFCGKGEREKQILLLALPYAIFLIAMYLTRIALNGFGYVGDEANIYKTALDLYPFMFGITSEVYIISFFFLPIPIAPSLVKILFDSLIVGYIIYRAKNYYNSAITYILYLPFFTKPVIENSMLIHRMQWYGMLYVFVCVKLFFDYKEKKCIDYRQVAILSALISVLTIWRREGLYLFVSGAILLCVIYHKKLNWKKVCVIFFAIECLVALPLRLVEKGNMSDANTAFYTIAVHMLGENIDRELYRDEIEAIDQVLSVEIIDKFNSDFGMASYDDTYWGWKDYQDNKYYAVRDYTQEENDALRQAVIKIVIREPLAFIKTRVKAWNRVAAQSNLYNLNLPLLISIAILLYGLLKKNYVLLLLFGGILIHTALAAMTMPASYFKYFYAMWLLSYIMAIIILIDENMRKRINIVVRKETEERNGVN